MPRLIWDEVKRQANIYRHAIDFAEIEMSFFDEAAILSAHSGRSRAVGLLNGREIALIFRPPGAEAISLISARPANAKEKRLFRESR